MRALRGGVERIHRLAARHEQPVPLLADEAQVRSSLGHQHLADLRAVWRIDVDAVHAFAAKSGPTPDIAVDIRANAIVKTRIERREFTTVGQTAAAILNIPCDDLRFLAGVMRRGSVGDVDAAVI